MPSRSSGSTIILPSRCAGHSSSFPTSQHTPSAVWEATLHGSLSRVTWSRRAGCDLLHLVPLPPMPPCPVRAGSGATTVKAQQYSTEAGRLPGGSPPPPPQSRLLMLPGFPLLPRRCSRDKVVLGYALGFGEGTHDGNTMCVVGRWRYSSRGVGPSNSTRLARLARLARHG